MRFTPRQRPTGKLPEPDALARRRPPRASSSPAALPIYLGGSPWAGGGAGGESLPLYLRAALEPHLGHTGPDASSPCCDGCAAGTGCAEHGGEQVTLGISDTTGPGACPPGYTICDFLHGRITMEAQLALSDMYDRGGEDCDIALSILGAVEHGELEGVYVEDQGKPALMGQRHGVGWWDLVPPGEGAVVSELESPPMIVLDKQVASRRAVLATELKEAWLRSSFGGRSIAPPPPKLHGCAAAPKKPPPKEPPPKEPPPGPGEPCSYPRCDLSVATTVWPVCGLNSHGVPFDCSPVPGETCGVCEGTPASRACHDKNEQRHRSERKRCRDEYSAQRVAEYITFECAQDMAECLWKKDFLACAEMAGCFLDPAPLDEYEECLGNEDDRHRAEAERCNTLP